MGRHPAGPRTAGQHTRAGPTRQPCPPWPIGDRPDRWSSAEFPPLRHSAVMAMTVNALATTLAPFRDAEALKRPFAADKPSRETSRERIIHDAHHESAYRRGPDDRASGGFAGRQLVRYGLVVVIAWIGALKYSSYEAAAIHPLIANSPLMSWFYDILSVRALAATLGTVEIIAALLIGLRAVSPRVSATGSAMAVVLFLGTLSFLFTTPGVTAAGGFPVLSVLPGQFLLKDLVLLGASLWTLGDSLGAATSRAKSNG